MIIGPTIGIVAISADTPINALVNQPMTIDTIAIILLSIFRLISITEIIYYNYPGYNSFIIFFIYQFVLPLNSSH